MKIGGFQPFSLSDFPNCVSAIVFTQGCNFRCPFCHNPSLVLPELFLPPIPEESLFTFLNERKNKLDGVVITGGEPTIQSDLWEFVRKIKELGYKVKLDTNGSNPEVVEKLIYDNLIDYFAMDIKAPWYKYTHLTGVETDIETIKKTMTILLQTSIPCDFRLTYAKPLLNDEDIEEVQSYLPPNRSLTIQKFIPKNVLNPNLFI
ncbi:MAG TPA: anaerobic ribonucleoside-triphosphate reductase activating protein [Candidatus Hydrogenedens sp.]|nr:anaerobic ribonucleoside-triphosphate reductase activating protein [Candidatus Hydrogenedens sp.]